MSSAGSRHRQTLARSTAGLLWLILLLPMGGVLALALQAAASPAAWAALADDPQWPQALALSLCTGVAATLLSTAIAAYILSRLFPAMVAGRARWMRALAPMLALPHVAAAIGLAFLIAPSGWLLRMVSPWATGLHAPPPWITTQDPWGLALVLVLVIKEVPFLLWVAAAQWQQPAWSQRIAREWLLARTLGHSGASAWWRLVWPQWLALWRAPLLAVLAYSLGVVDVALVIGPAQPPTLGLLAWQWLGDVDPLAQARGAAAGWLLAAALAALVLLWRRASAHPVLRQAIRGWMVRGPRARARVTGGHSHPARQARGQPWLGLVGVYGALAAALLVSSVIGSWPFPAVWPESWTWQAWRQVVSSTQTLQTTLWLALASATAALAWVVAWLQCAPAAWDRHIARALAFPLVLPPVLWVLGLHALLLHWGWDLQASGLWLAHTLAVLPYVWLALSPAWRQLDPRLMQTAASLGLRPALVCWRVTLPLLRGPLSSAMAVGAAVSVAQYLPTAFIGGGRWSTVTTEAVTLAAGSQRSLTAAFAWLQWLLPVLGFALAAWLARPRRFAARGQGAA